MDQAHEEIRAAGGDVVAIFQYRPHPTRNFCRRRGVGLDCLGDPDREAYRAVGLERGGIKEYGGPQMVGRFVKAASRGHFVNLPKGGDVSQLPGTFVVRRRGEVALAHYNSDASDNPSNDVVLQALREASRA